MTREEAKLSLLEYCPQLCGNEINAFGCNSKECEIGVAIEALEKQIPKTPEFVADGYADGMLVYDTWICPCCETEYEEYDFCPKCGQKIDWSGWRK